MFEFDPLETTDIKKKEVIWNEWMYGGGGDSAEGGGDPSDPAVRPVPLDLHTAASLGLYDTVRDLLAEKDVKHSSRNMGGWTPLMYASYIGHDTVLDLLLAAGADVTSVNMKGRTALMLACCCGNEAAAYTLLQARADIDAIDYRGKTALFHAVSNGHSSLTRFMLESGANPNVKERLHGYTPLIEAAIEDQQMVVEALLEFGADWRIKLANGHSARTLALKHNHLSVVEMIDRRINESAKRQAFRNTNGSGAAKQKDGDLLQLRGSEMRRNESITVNANMAQPPCAKSPSIHEGPMSFAKILSNSLPKGQEQKLRSGASVENDDNDITIRNADSSWNKSGSKVDPYVGKPHTPAVTWSDGVTGREEAIDSVKTQGNEAPSVFASSTDRLKEVVVQDPRLNREPKGVNRGSEGIQRRSSVGSNQQLPHVVAFNPIVTAQTSSSSTPYPYLHNLQVKETLNQEWREYLQRQKQNAPHTSQDQGVTEETFEKRNGGQLGDMGSGMTNANQVPISMVQQQPLPPPQQRNTPPVETTTQIDLAQLLEHIQCSKWLPKFQEQDVDINVFYTMTDNDLKEIGINLLGPRRKMTTAIARHHQNMAVNLSTLEQTYANKLQNDIDDINKQLVQANCAIDQLKTALSNEQEAKELISAKLNTCENLLANCYKKLESSNAHNKHLLAALLKLRSLNSDSATTDRQAFGKELDNLCQHLSHILTQVSPQTSSS